MKLTRKQAFELSIKKWEAKVNGEAKPVEVVILLNECGLCEKYLNRNCSSIEDACAKCPINIIPYKGDNTLGCSRNRHPFYDYDRRSHSIENAQKVLDLIKSKQ